MANNSLPPSLLIAGTFAVVQLITGNSVEQVFAEFDALRNCSVIPIYDTNGTEVLFLGELTTCDAVKVDVVITLSLLVGIILVC